MISATNYPYKTWQEYYKDKEINLSELLKHRYVKIFKNMSDENVFDNIEKKLAKQIQTGTEIFPYPELVFYGLNKVRLEDLKVVILGQDPYPGFEIIDGKKLPQAMGVAFSVPKGLKLPASLLHIFQNQEKFGLIKEIPKNGNLIHWVKQGVLLLNCSLTVINGRINSHADLWKDLTDYLIKYISEHTEHINFVLWGAFALDKKPLIDETKHNIIISSHPSPNSYMNPLRSYGSFMSVDHFGLINEYLKTNNKTPILWDRNDYKKIVK